MAVFSDRKINRFLVGGQICGIIINSQTIKYMYIFLVSEPTELYVTLTT